MEEKEYIFCEIAEERIGKKRVLIVDDDVEMLKILRFYLRDVYDVSVVNSGKIAMALMQEEKYIPDVMLLDYLMPEYNGGELFRVMKKDKSLRTIPVIFLTGVTDNSTIKECLSFGPADYIIKPVGKSALLAKLKTFFEL